MSRALALTAILVLAAGCRSDGGFGRSSSAQDLAWSTSCLADHSARGWEATKATFASIPSSFVNSFSDGWREMGYTMNLYLENHQSKPGYARYEGGK